MVWNKGSGEERWSVRVGSGSEGVFQGEVSRESMGVGCGMRDVDEDEDDTDSAFGSVLLQIVFKTAVFEKIYN